MLVGPPQELFDVERPALTCVERPQARVDVTAQRSQFLDVRKQLAANLFLIGIGKFRDLRNGLFKRLDHAAL